MGKITFSTFNEHGVPVFTGAINDETGRFDSGWVRSPINTPSHIEGFATFPTGEYHFDEPLRPTVNKNGFTVYSLFKPLDKDHLLRAIVTLGKREGDPSFRADVQVVRRKGTAA